MNPQRDQTASVQATAMDRETSPGGTLAVIATREAKKRSPLLRVTSLGTRHARRRDVTICLLDSVLPGKGV